MITCHSQHNLASEGSFFQLLHDNLYVPDRGKNGDFLRAKSRTHSKIGIDQLTASYSHNKTDKVSRLIRTIAHYHRHWVSIMYHRNRESRITLNPMNRVQHRYKRSEIIYTIQLRTCQPMAVAAFLDIEHAEDQEIYCVKSSERDCHMISLMMAQKRSKNSLGPEQGMCIHKLAGEGRKTTVLLTERHGFLSGVQHDPPRRNGCLDRL